MNIFELHKYQKKLKCFSLALGFVILANGNIKSINSQPVEESIGYEEIEDTDDIVLSYICEEEYESSRKFSPKVIPRVMSEAKKEQIDKLMEEYFEIEEVEEEMQEELSYEEKIQVIMERDGYTYNELDEVFAGCVAESCDDGNNYDEAYNTSSTVYNRAHDIGCVNYVSNLCGKNTGYSIYYQFICPGQFCVYSDGSYYKYLGRIDLPGYQAAIDMFYSKKPSHDYLKFNNVPPYGEYERLVSNGNFYSQHQRAENIILDEEVNERVLSKNN